VDECHTHNKMSTMNLSAYFLYSPNDINPEQLVGVKILPIVNNEPIHRRPFHLALILDTSGSMEGQRMNALCRTLHLLTDKLNCDDKLTIIEYNNSGKTLAVDVVMSESGKTQIHEIIHGLVADGGTNMESAFGELYKIVQNNTVSPIDSVFVLTDGHINNGMTSSAGLMNLLMRSLPIGTPINTLGYGADHNARLLRDISLRSSGSYTFADTDEMLPTIIGDITGGLASEMGRNATLMIPPGWTCMELGASTGIEVYTFGTLIADKPHWILFKGPAGATTPQFTLTYTYNGVDFEHDITPIETQTVLVAAQRDRVHVAKTFSHVSDMIMNGRSQEALPILTQLATDLDTSEAKDELMIVRLRAQVEEMIDILRNSLNHENLRRQPARLNPMLSRLASDTSALGNQRGILSNINTPHMDDPDDVNTMIFSSPIQRLTSTEMSQQYDEIMN